jgi:hypothetical protein
MRRGLHGPAAGIARAMAVLTLAGLALATVMALPATARTADSTTVTTTVTATVGNAFRDSLKVEIQRYARLIAALRDSVDALEEADQPRQERLLEVERSIGALGESMSELTEQLSSLQFEVQDGRLSLRDARGGEVSVEIPSELPEQLREGLSSLTRVILEEMPDTVRIGDQSTGFTWSWDDDGIAISPVAPPAPRRTIEGGLVKFREPLEVASDEIVLGDVVAILGDAVISGHVQGNVVVVLGDSRLTETAVVDGEVVSVLGSLDRADGAAVGSVTAINPGVDLTAQGLDLGGGWFEFLGWQLSFALLLLLVVILVAIMPAARLDPVIATLEARPAESLGIGLLLGLVGHLLAIGLIAILVLTVIGIPVALLLLLAVVLVDLLAIGVAGIVVGRRICERVGLGCGHPWREAALGMMLLHVPALVAAFVAALGAPAALVLPLSWFGRLIKFAAFCAGLGALALGRFGARSASTVPTTLGTAADGQGAA